MNILLVFLGGGLGSLARYCVGVGIGRLNGGSTFPWHTLSINLLGAFVIGGVAEFLALRTASTESVRLLLVTGFLGGFTTFSAFSLESALMLERGDYLSCAAYIGASVLGTIALVFGGTAVMKAVL